MLKRLYTKGGPGSGSRLAIVAAITLPTIALLWPFIFGAPGKSLASLWSNSFEVTNAVTIGIALAVVAAISCLFRGPLAFLFVAAASLMATAGLAATAVTALATFAALAVGFQVITRQGMASVAGSTVARLAIAFWVGKGMHILCLALLSGTPINTRWLHGVILLAMIGFCRTGARDAWESLAAVVSFRVNRIGGNTAIARFLLRFAILLLIFASIHTDMDGDALTMHMRIAREMLQYGAWDYNVAEYVFAVMPIGPQLNFAAMFLLGGVEAVKTELFIQFMAMLTLLTCGGISRPGRIGMTLAAVFACLPMFIREIAGLYVDVTLSGFCLAAAVLITAAIRRQSREFVILALFCAAAAMASKPHGFFLALPIGLLAIPLWLRAKPSTMPGPARLSFVIGASVLLAGFFYILALWKTGNPVFPFMNGTFNSPDWHPMSFADPRWVGLVSWDMLWRMTFESSRFEESSNGSMGLLLIFLALCLFGLLRLPRVGRIALIPLCFGVLYLIGAGTQSQYLRYLLPGFVMIGTGLAFALRWTLCRRSELLWYSAILALLVANMFGMPAGRLRNGMLHVDPENYLIAGSYRDMPSLNLQEEYLNGHKYIANVLNHSVRSHPTTLLLGTPYGAHFNGRTIYTTWHNYSWETIKSGFTKKGEFDKFVNSQKISHVVVDAATFGDERKLLLPLVLARYEQVAELWGIKLYGARKEPINEPMAVPLKGFSDHEPGIGIWTASTVASMALSSPTGADMQIHIRPLDPSIGRLRVKIDGKFVLDEKAVKEAEYRVVFSPKEKILSHLEIFTDRTPSPKELGMNDDERTLGVMVSGPRLIPY